MEEAMNSAPATVAIPGYLAGTWKADPVHSEIAFFVRHLMISKVRGRFTSYDVTIVTSEDPRGSSVAATIDLWGGQRAGFSATAQINRRDFGIDISIPMDGGGVAVGDKVSISLEIEAVLQK
jgi:polyisoprenoid-binding protein YceI